MIALRNVSVRREGRLILGPLSVELGERRIGIIGANGSGKSTFARLLNGLILPSEGEVLVGERDTRRAAKDIRRDVGFVFQNPDNQIVYPTVGEDLAFGLKNRGIVGAEAAARIEAVLARYELSGFRDRLVHELSGGERQLVAIAGVMVMRPKLIVFDEPTTLLDLRNKRRVMAAIEAADEAAILVTHDLDLLGGFDRVIGFERGSIFADGPPQEAVAAYRALIG